MKMAVLSRAAIFCHYFFLSPEGGFGTRPYGKNGAFTSALPHGKIGQYRTADEFPQQRVVRYIFRFGR